MEQNAETTAEVQKPVHKVIVKYGYLGFVGEFEYDGEKTLIPSQPVLVETDRGIELGRTLCYSSAGAKGVKVDPAQVARYVQASGSEYLNENVGKVIRPATSQDLCEEHHIHADARNKKSYCMEMGGRLGLKMDIVCVEHIFGGERIIFYFTADGRIDFRELVRDLAKEYQTRIELRQIGARDEARLLADYEICGRECCCKNCLKTLRPVNMKMAKLQKATLDPSKVSGRCGRLRCCLRFEQKTYEELIAMLPSIGSWVQTEQGVGKVKDRQVLTQLVTVILENRLVSFPLDEISPVDSPDAREPAPARVKAVPAERSVPEAEKKILESEAEPVAELQSVGENEQGASAEPQKPSGSRRRRNRRKKKK
jgi:cell fate regulator YaaT (PSP1 superfamily)